ncbi:helix-turn-helix domain-containing protein [Pseudonocardia sp. N23]|uniref:helix-turn-helix domain-containing protein n=1 Tax=Pseudonocardia sp. N23 TaxID=1987376 RepID=UPI0015599B07|nr:helix-turn-helix domain-containing protein [Pseudonocardia sp. N23]
MADPDGSRTEWLHAAADVLRALNAEESPATLLRRVARHTCTLTGADSCAVMLLDETGQRLVVRASHGLTEAYRHDLDTLRPLLVHPTGRAFDVPAAQAVRERRTVVLSDVAGLGGPWRDAADREGIRTILAVPLETGDECPGVLIGYSRRAHRFAGSEIALAELMAEYVATVLRTSQVKDVQRATIAELEKTNTELTTAVASLHHERAQREWAEAQDRRLVRLLLDDAGLDGVLAALGEALAARVVLEAADGSVLAQAGDGPALDVADAAAPVPDTATLLDLPGARAWVLPLAVAHETVARLWVLRAADAGSDAPPLARSVIERFAPLVALELHKRDHAVDTALRLTRDLAVDLVTGAGRDVDLRDRARALGHDLSRPHTVVLVAGDSAAALRRALGQGALVGEDTGSTVALVPDADRDVVVAALHRIGAAAVIGRVVVDTADYPAAWRVLRTAVALARSGVVDIEDLGVATLLLETGTPDGLRRLADRRLGRLEAHDAQRSTELVATLRAWLDAGGSTGAAGRALHVHPHTVGYRLRRVAELTGLDPQRADDVFELRVAVMVRAVQDAAAGGS